MHLNNDFREFLQFLNSNEVEYLIIGGYAVAVHGHPRYTKDIDIWIRPTQLNAKRLVKAIDEFGFGSLGLSADDFLSPDTIVQIGYPPRRIDLLTAPSGVEFEGCFARRFLVEVDGIHLSFIALHDLKSNKRASGRPQDLADIDNLSH